MFEIYQTLCEQNGEYPMPIVGQAIKHSSISNFLATPSIVRPQLPVYLFNKHTTSFIQHMGDVNNIQQRALYISHLLLQNDVYYKMLP